MKPRIITTTIATGDFVDSARKLGTGRKISAPVMIRYIRRRPYRSERVPVTKAAKAAQSAPISSTLGTNFGSTPITATR